ncbi:hypothetical protein NB525_04435 [Vibrio alginolyticus]|uniref:hypothetical protein n=1 Tax=Vibrio TaxID=662 RepID=UPI0007A9B63E|nr:MULTISPECIES: hypothetical protein [Vibrio]ELA9341932.1 hypothetical protein [Vibrio parahaemolyticus]EIC9813249.1 hypothetical protein [Vibrio alginolyticus]EII5413245.1 hypothetical protein [Vibrio alginolyticus]KZC48356.1 hypothetical protein XM68_c10352 [Vibrio alginolyticus]MBS9914329.1 hypothetical protein [Vibrio alginolyticus]
MTVVKMASQSITNKEQSKVETKKQTAPVLSLTARKKMIAFENAKENMKLAAEKLDW